MKESTRELNKALVLSVFSDIEDLRKEGASVLEGAEALLAENFMRYGCSSPTDELLKQRVEEQLVDLGRQVEELLMAAKVIASNPVKNFDN